MNSASNKPKTSPHASGTTINTSAPPIVKDIPNKPHRPDLAYSNPSNKLASNPMSIAPKGLQWQSTVPAPRPETSSPNKRLASCPQSTSPRRSQWLFPASNPPYRASTLCVATNAPRKEEVPPIAHSTSNKMEEPGHIKSGPVPVNRVAGRTSIPRPAFTAEGPSPMFRVDTLPPAVPVLEKMERPPATLETVTDKADESNLEKNYLKKEETPPRISRAPSKRRTVPHETENVQPAKRYDAKKVLKEVGQTL